MKFNLPKHKVHKEAAKLGAVCSAVVDSVQSRLEANARRTDDEERHREWLRREKKRALIKEVEKRGGKMLRVGEEIMMIEDQKQPVYHLPHEDLFDLTEHPLQDTLIQNSNLLNQDAVKDARGNESSGDEDNDQDDEDHADFTTKRPTDTKKRSRK